MSSHNGRGIRVRLVFKCGVSSRGVGDLLYHPPDSIDRVGISGIARDDLFLCCLVSVGSGEIGRVCLAVEEAPVVHGEGVLEGVGFRGVVPAVVLEGIGSDSVYGDGLQVVGLASIGVALV